MPSSRRFLIWFAGTLAIGLFLLGSAAVLADPRGIFVRAWPGAPRLCEPGLYVDAREAKPYLPALAPPREALFGTSRVMVGFSEHDAAALLGRDTLNLAVPDVKMAEVALLFDEAAAAGTLKRAWIGLDFSMFRGGGSVQFSRPRPLPRLIFTLRYGILDPAVLRGAVGRFFHRCAIQATMQGFAPPDAQWDWPAAQEEAAQRAEAWRTLARSGSPIATKSYRAQVAQLRLLAASARRRGIALIVFVSPSPPLLGRAMASGGLMEDQRTWRRDVEQAARAGGAVFLDASGKAPEDCISEQDARCAFVDLTHFRPFIGRRILEAGLAAAGKAPPLAPPAPPRHAAGL
jgi:hypothetical protein